MSEWNQEAYEYLDGYLKQVSALAKQQGDDADEIVSGLRDHIAHEVTANDDDIIDIDSLLAVLGQLGSPEEVLQTELTPVSSQPKPAVIDSTAKKNVLTGCVVFVMVASVIMIGMIIMAVMSYSTVQQEVSTPEPVVDVNTSPEGSNVSQEEIAQQTIRFADSPLHQAAKGVMCRE